MEESSQVRASLVSLRHQNWSSWEVGKTRARRRCPGLQAVNTASLLCCRCQPSLAAGSAAARQPLKQLHPRGQRAGRPCYETCRLLRCRCWGWGPGAGLAGLRREVDAHQWIQLAANAHAVGAPLHGREGERQAGWGGIWGACRAHRQPAAVALERMPSEPRFLEFQDPCATPPRTRQKYAGNRATAGPNPAERHPSSGRLRACGRCSEQPQTKQDEHAVQSPSQPTWMSSQLRSSCSTSRSAAGRGTPSFCMTAEGSARRQREKR